MFYPLIVVIVPDEVQSLLVEVHVLALVLPHGLLVYRNFVVHAPSLPAYNTAFRLYHRVGDGLQVRVHDR